MIASRRSQGWRPYPQVALGAAREIRLPDVYEWKESPYLALGVLGESVKPPRHSKKNRILDRVV